MIVTADDFGYSDDVNAAIIEAFERGLATTASMLANMPAFEDASELAHQHRLRDRLGVHLNLTEGEPLTESIRARPRFCDEHGRFFYWRSGDRAFHLARTERDAVAAELRAQILRHREQGLVVAHLDSHNHVHNKRAIAAIVIALARELAIPRVRLAHNSGTRIRFVNRAYKAWINAGLRRAGLAGTRWLGSVDDYARLKESGVRPELLDSFEVVTHPSYRGGVLVDFEHPDRSLEQLLGQMVNGGGP